MERESFNINKINVFIERNYNVFKILTEKESNLEMLLSYLKDKRNEEK